MNRNLLFIFSLLLQFAFAQSNIPQVVKDAANCQVNFNIESDSTVKEIFQSSQYGGSEGLKKGVGFLIKDDSSQKIYLVSVAHVISSKIKPKILKGDNTLGLEMEDWVWDSQKDLAIAEVKSKDLPPNLQPLTFAKSLSFNVGEKTYIPEESNINQGVLKSLDESSNDNIAAYHLLDCSNKVEEGQSGSPILNENGQIIGILLRQKSSGGCFALDGNTFQKLFRQLQKDKKIQRFYTGIVFEMNKDGKPVIKYYIPNSPAAQSPFSQQSTYRPIISINSQPVHNLQDIHKILEDLPSSSMLLFFKFEDNTQLSVHAKISDTKAQEDIADYFFQQFIPETPQTPNIVRVYVKQEVRNKYKYEIREKSQLGAVIRTFSWNNQLICWDGENKHYTALESDAKTPRKILIF